MDLVTKRNCKSSVWLYFGFRSDENGNPRDLDQPICRQCRKIVPSKGGSTTNLRAHLKKRHRRNLAEDPAGAPPEYIHAPCRYTHQVQILEAGSHRAVTGSAPTHIASRIRPHAPTHSEVCK